MEVEKEKDYFLKKVNLIKLLLLTHKHSKIQILKTILIHFKNKTVCLYKEKIQLMTT